MTVITQEDLIQSVADALQYASGDRSLRARAASGRQRPSPDLPELTCVRRGADRPGLGAQAATWF